MSAITGIFYRDGREVDSELIKKMNDKLSHRGPDGSDFWYEGSIALGHQMLWTTQESLHENLPYHNKKAGLVITADARIDNREELSEELDIKDKEDISDSYFILKSYEKWGEKCPEHLLGDFAFAIWDEKDEKLFCARDHMGVKPFYYYLDDKMFVFGTEIKSLFAIPGVPYKLNELKLGFFLPNKNIKDDKIFTFYEGILRLIPAYYASITVKTKRMKRYWKLDPNSDIVMDSEEDYIEAFLKIFKEAVNCRLRSALPIGFDLSGGLDSSSIVCMAKNILSNKSPQINLNTFSYVFDEFPQIDERFYIEKVINTGEIEANYIFADKISPLEHEGDTLSQQDQPYINPFFPIIRSSFKNMHEKNIRILLSGTGGDNLFTNGKKYFVELAVKFQWYQLIRELKLSAKVRNQSFYRKLFTVVIFPLIPNYLKKLLNKLICPFTTKVTCKPNYLNRDFAKKLENNRGKYCKDFKKLNKLNTFKKYHYILLTGDVIQEHFENLDLASGTFSLDLRHPYYDKRLVEFCYSLPNEMKVNVWNRFIQRAAMEGIIPPEIQKRNNKGDFSPFLIRNLLLFEKNQLDMMIYNNEIIKDYLDIRKIKSIYEKYKMNKNITYMENYLLYIALHLFLWLKEKKF